MTTIIVYKNMRDGVSKQRIMLLLLPRLEKETRQIHCLILPLDIYLSCNKCTRLIEPISDSNDCWPNANYTRSAQHRLKSVGPMHKLCVRVRLNRSLARSRVNVNGMPPSDEPSSALRVERFTTRRYTIKMHKTSGVELEEEVPPAPAPAQTVRGGFSPTLVSPV